VFGILHRSAVKLYAQFNYRASPNWATLVEAQANQPPDERFANLSYF
jgi:hypothetical protein